MADIQGTSLQYFIYMCIVQASLVSTMACLNLLPAAAITFVALDDQIWSPLIPRQRFVARAFPPIALI